jgi:hypothetical protein
MYPHGLWCGLLAVAWLFWRHGWAPPGPLLASVLFTPYAAVSGFLTARHHSVDAGMVVGGVTALTGHVIVFAATVVYSAATVAPWSTTLLWLALGVVYALLPILLGAFFGLLGGFLARFLRSMPSN